MKKIIILAMTAIGIVGTGYANSTRTGEENSPAKSDSISHILDKAKQGDANAQNMVGAWYYTGKNVEQNYAQAYEWWKKAALQGNAEAIGNFAMCYQFGRGIEKDSTDALRLYMKSIKEGNKQLLEERSALAGKKSAFDGVLVALCYQKGNGVAKDIAKAIEFFRKAATINSVDAQRELALCYMNNKLPDKASAWFKKAAEQDDVTSTFYYGKMLLDGNGVAKDTQNAVIYLLKAANKGFPQAEVETGNLYATGTGVTKNEETAVQWYRKAAYSGNVHGAWNLAVCYMKGHGIMHDYDQALFWFAEASAGGYKRTFKKMLAENEEVRQSAFPQFLKGMKHYLIEKNYDAAMEAFNAVEKAKLPEGKTMQAVCYANKDYAKYNIKKAVKLLSSTSDTQPAGAFYLATLYENGKGVNKDMAKAIELYEKSANAGYGTAQCYIGDIYYEGRGTAQNYTKAVEYYMQAQAQRQLTPNSAKRLASCYENGWGELTVDKKKATDLLKEKRTNNIKSLLETVE